MVKKLKKEDRREVAVKIKSASFSLHEFDFCTLDEAIERLVAIRDANKGKKIEMRVEEEPYSDGYKYCAFYERRLETDEEMKARKEAQAKLEKEQEARERETFERLSRKFGKGV